jgi:hypothetical protein
MLLTTNMMSSKTFLGTSHSLVLEQLSVSLLLLFSTPDDGLLRSSFDEPLPALLLDFFTLRLFFVNCESSSSFCISFASSSSSGF